ncbi:MAG: LPS O-antigen length regulator [Alteromonadaceae bacterium]|nr:MAG: LPS O-antigen length regulator [Alteromonadaceae bacterium]
MLPEIERSNIPDSSDTLIARLSLIERKIDSLSGIAGVTKSEEIDLRELWWMMWEGKFVVVVTTAVFAVLAVFYALSLPNIYHSEALLASAEDKSSGGFGALSGQFGGLADLAGVDLGGGGGQVALAIEVMRSRKFIRQFIAKHELLVPLMAGGGWNSDADVLVIDSAVYDEKTSRWVADDDVPASKAAPSNQKAHRVFSALLSVSQDSKTALVTIGFDFYSPTLAKQWVDWLVEDINAEIRDRDVEEARRSIDYLTAQLAKTSISDMQSVFYELIEQQTKTIMFANARSEYVFKTVDDAIVPERKSKPSRALIVVYGILFGGMLSLLFVIVRYFVRREVASVVD